MSGSSVYTAGQTPKKKKERKKTNYKNLIKFVVSHCICTYLTSAEDLCDDGSK